MEYSRFAQPPQDISFFLRSQGVEKLVIYIIKYTFSWSQIYQFQLLISNFEKRKLSVYLAVRMK